MANAVILACPACGGQLESTRLHCSSCSVVIEGRFAASPFARLSIDQQEFVKTFLAARGNIKMVEQQLGMSYPTVRSRLAGVQQALGLPDLAAGEEARADKRAVLDRVESGELSVDEAIEALGEGEA